jgi:hypothetical protein
MDEWYRWVIYHSWAINIFRGTSNLQDRWWKKSHPVAGDLTKWVRSSDRHWPGDFSLPWRPACLPSWAAANRIRAPCWCTIYAIYTSQVKVKKQSCCIECKPTRCGHVCLRLFVCWLISFPFCLDLSYCLPSPSFFPLVFSFNKHSSNFCSCSISLLWVIFWVFPIQRNLDRFSLRCPCATTHSASLSTKLSLQPC